MKTLSAEIAVACLLFVQVARSQTTPGWIQNPVNGLLFSSPPTWPMKMGYTRFAYDPFLRRVLYIARQNLCLNWTNSLWAYNLPTNEFTMMTWSGSFPDPHVCAKVPGVSPAPDTATYFGDRHNQTVAYDTLRSRFVIYSGDCDYEDMYHWFSFEPAYPTTEAGSGWAVDCNPCSPGVRVEGAMTFTSPTSDLIVLYGGLQSGTAEANTWQYYGTSNTWTKIVTSCVGAGCTPCGTGCSNLGARAGHTMVWDTVNQKVILFGGYKAGGAPQNDTWEYDPRTRTWTNYNPPVKPPAVKYPALAFDSARDLIWLHDALVNGSCSGGCDWTYSTATHTWMLQPETGGPVPQGTNTQNTLLMDYDAHCDALVATASSGTSTPTMWYLALSGSLTCSP